MTVQSVHNFLFNGKIETKLKEESHKICASLLYAFNPIDVVHSNKLIRIIPAVYVSWLFFFRLIKYVLVLLTRTWTLTYWLRQMQRRLAIILVLMITNFFSVLLNELWRCTSNFSPQSPYSLSVCLCMHEFFIHFHIILASLWYAKNYFRIVVNAIFCIDHHNYRIHFGFCVIQWQSLQIRFTSKLSGQRITSSICSIPFEHKFHGKINNKDIEKFNYMFTLMRSFLLKSKKIQIK